MEQHEQPTFRFQEKPLCEVGKIGLAIPDTTLGKTLCRRELLFLLAITALCPLHALGEVRRTPWRIGVLSGINRPKDIRTMPLAGLLDGLKELGYIERRDFSVEWRFSGGDYERFYSLAEDLVRQNVDVVVVTGSAGI